MADTTGVNFGANPWSPFKELYITVNAALSNKLPDAYYELENVLRKHKPDFISLLQNPAKNAQHREAVKKADVQGINIADQPGVTTLPKSFIEEALIISDLFDLNEYSAVQLLLAGERQQAYYPGLTRGLVAVLLYYDGRRSLVNALQLLIQARRGRTWTLELEEEVVDLVTRFTDELQNEGFVRKVLNLLQGIDVTKDLDKLGRERALGDVKHRHEVTSLMNEIRTSLAECVYSWSCQTPLAKEETKRLMTHLQKNVGTSGDGTLDDVTIPLLMAFLYCVDVSGLEPRAEDRDDLVKFLPLLRDVEFIQDIHRDLVNEESDWVNGGVKDIMRFAWAVTLRNLAQQPEMQDMQEFVEEDEMIADTAIKANVFQFLKDTLVTSKSFHKTEFYVRCIHNLLTGFIIQMPLKVKEIRNRGDDVGRLLMMHAREGTDPPANLPRYFEDFMKLLGTLYMTDPLNLELSLEFWCPPDHSPGHGASYLSHVHQKHSHRQVSLFKFVRMAGDLLPPSLFIPYINMLRGLSNGTESAHQCFNFLKNNGMGGGGNASSVSWDHFFLSINRYYTNLRHEVAGSPLPEFGTAQIVQRYHVAKGITPHELEGLIAVLKLTQMIAKHDDDARVALCDNRSWLPVVLLFGLLSCGIPPGLKAECLRTLATLSASPEVTTTFWQSLEVSQIIPTVALPGAPASGLPVELDEIESRNEEYPLTIAFLELINSLTNVAVPPMLGAGYRAPGFDPYLEFLRDTVFLKYRSRAYRNTEEKWEVAAGVTDIFYKLLRDHEPRLENFVDQPIEVQGGGTTIANKAPGHHLLIHMLNDSDMLRLILSILDETARLLDQYRPIPGKEHMLKCSQNCLMLLQLALEKQDVFIDLIRGQGSGVMVTPMDDLLMAINPRTGKADHLVNIAKFVTHGGSHPELALTSVKVLYNTICSSNVQPQLVGLFTTNEVISKRLLHGFVECLETDDPEEEEEELQQIQAQETEESDDDSSKIRSATRLYIMRLLLYSLEQPSPNLAHFLLGFETRKLASKTNLQDPGILNSPRTCLHSILGILDRGLTPRSGPAAIYTMPQLAELCYEMLYKLCANRETCSPTMRYLRANQDFFCRHLRHVPFINKTGSDTEERYLLNQQSWLLKAVAVEIRLTSVNRLRSHTQRLLRLLLEDAPSVVVDDQEDGDVGGDFTVVAEQTGIFGMSTTMQQREPQIAGVQIRRKILTLLDSVDFAQDFPQPLRLEYLDPTVIERVIKSCEQGTERGVTLTSVSLLHKVLMTELNLLQGSSAVGQRPLVAQEIEGVLHNVVERNHTRQGLSAKRHAFDAWRQVAEVVLTSCSMEVLPLEVKQRVVVELLQQLLTKVCSEDAVSELTSPVAGALLTLMATLRQCILNSQSETIPQMMSSQYVHVLDGTMVSAREPTVPEGRVRIPVVSLTAILKELLKFILISGGGQQQVRANLYGALLNYLQIPQKPREIPTLQDSAVLNSAMLEEYERITNANLVVIEEYGDNLMELVCKDSCDSHEVGRMLALSVVTAMITIDKRGNWQTFLSSKGYMRHFAASIVQEDQALQTSLQPTPEPLRALYIYESRMSLLTKLAENPVGAQALLQAGIMDRLAECHFLDLRPEHDVPRYPKVVSNGMETVEAESFIPSIMHRYRQLLHPVLKLCMAILTSLGSQHKEATNQVLHFVVSHSDVFTVIMREQHSSLKLEALQELALTTSVVGTVTADGKLLHFVVSHSDVFTVIMREQHSSLKLEALQELALTTSVVGTVTADVEYYDSNIEVSSKSGTSRMPLQSHLSRLHRQMLALMPRYCCLDRWLRELKAMETSPDGRSKEEREGIRQALLDIESNVLNYCRAVVAYSGNSAEECQVLFTPSLQEALARDYQRIEGLHVTSLDTSKPPSLGLVVRHFRQSCTEFTNTLEAHQQFVHKLRNVADLTNEELKELTQSSPNTTLTEKLSSNQRLQMATGRLTTIVRVKAKELALLYNMIESCLFLVWRHMEFYFVHCQKDQSMKFPSLLSSSSRPQPRSLTGYPGYSSIDRYHDGNTTEPLVSPLAVGITKEDLKQLKVDALNCLNDTLLKQVQELEGRYGKGRSRYAFMAALVRRVRGLLALES